ncbi:MAG TPA: DUF192 domain-containing protein [Candidatus Paceibacterota bacterium]|nr:DUF192 domain-containing protein [Candidatus Paceibacterota bacterium]
METITPAKIRRGIFMALFVLILLSGLYSFAEKQKSKKDIESQGNSIGSSEIKTLTIRGIAYQVEVEKDEASLSKGLGGREMLAQNAGMLFVFDTPSEHGFWMKDTLIPLDMIWISEGKKIVHIEKNVQPSSYPTVYSNELNAEDGSDAALYVLELNAGEVDENQFAVGDEVLF